VKKAFTLFEIMITMILISLLYYFAINSFTNKTVKKTDTITLTNLKEMLLKYTFNNKIEIKCIEDDYSCFVFIDNVLQNEKIAPLFKEKPIIYEYNQELTRIEYKDLELEQLDRYNVIFEYSCGVDKKCSNAIVETPEKVYIYDDLYAKPKIIEFISDIDDYFDNLKREVKDAF